MNEPTQKNNKGFTLVELLVVIGLLGISIGVTNDILTSLVRSYSKTQVKNELEQQANFLGLKLERGIRSASGIVQSGNTNIIRLNKSDGSWVEYSFDSANSIMNMKFSDDSSTTFPVTSKTGTGGVRVTCDNFSSNCFYVVTNSAGVQTVSMYIKFDPATGSGTSFAGSAVISNTITIRNTY